MMKPEETTRRVPLVAHVLLVFLILELCFLALFAWGVISLSFTNVFSWIGLAGLGWLLLFGIWVFQVLLVFQQKRSPLVTWMVGLIVVGAFLCFAVVSNVSTNEAPSPEGRARRTAQSLASVSDSANAAGINLVENLTLEKAIDAIAIGQTVYDPGSPFHEAYFGVPNLSDVDKRNAAYFLKLVDNCRLKYQDPIDGYILEK